MFIYMLLKAFVVTTSEMCIKEFDISKYSEQGTIICFQTIA